MLVFLYVCVCFISFSKILRVRFWAKSTALCLHECFYASPCVCEYHWVYPHKGANRGTVDVKTETGPWEEKKGKMP